MIDTGSEEFALRKDRRLEQIHWATTRRRRHERLLAFAFDHRSQFVEMAAANGKTEADIDRFKLIALQAVTETAASHDGVGFWWMTGSAVQRFMPRPTMTSGSAGRSSSPVCSRWPSRKARISAAA